MNHFFRVFLLMLTCVGLVETGRGQGGTTYDNAAPPVVVPASPTAAPLFRAVDVPIDYYTGGQKLDLPLYTVKLGTLHVPIGLHYRGNGIKVEEEAGWTGLSWDLDVAGAIGRSVIGWPDEDNMKGYRRSANFLHMPGTLQPDSINLWYLNFANDNCKQYDLARGSYEMTPDNYFINLCGNSGRLFFDKDGQPYISPYKPWKITGSESSGFTVVTDDGTIYKLQLIESTTNVTETLPDDAITQFTANTAWYLTQIISANKTDTINISYKPIHYSSSSYVPLETYMRKNTLQTAPGCVGSPPEPHQSFTTSDRTISGYVVSGISTRNQRVELNSNLGRSDIPDSATGMPYKLDSIRVYAIAPGKADSLIKKFVFNYGYYSAGTTAINKRLKLLSLTESDAQAMLPQQYNFTYYNDELPAKNSKSQDLWGYDNGQFNTTMIPSYTDPSNGADVSLANRNVDTATAQQGLLQTIQYPTGDTTSFEYESHRYGKADPLVVNNTVEARTAPQDVPSPLEDTVDFTVPYDQYVDFEATIRAPVNLPGEAEVYVYPQGSSTAIYSTSATGIGQDYTKYLYAGQYRLLARKYISQVSAKITAHFQSMVPAPYVGNPMGGARISRMVQSDGNTTIVRRFQYLLNDTVSSGNILGTGVYSNTEYVPMLCDGVNIVGYWALFAQHSTSVTDVGGIRGGNVAYTKVTVLNGDNGENGREEYYYNFRADRANNGYPYAPSTSYEDVRGLLEKKLVYTADNRLVSKEENTYSINQNWGDPNFRAIYGMKAGMLKRANTFDGSGCPSGFGWNFQTSLYQVNQYWPVLAFTTQTTYSSSGSESLSTTTYFNYDTTNGQVIKKSLLTSRPNDTLFTYTKFANSFTGNTVYAEMINRNMVSIPVESDGYRNQTMVKKNLTNFSFFPAGANQMILPSSVQLQNGAGPLETRLLLNKYDKWGNLVSDNKSADARHIYLYGYQNVYPIAEIINADSAAVAYTSFEDNTAGAWTLNSGSTINAGSTITGNYSCSGGVTKTVPSGNYIVSCWASGSVTVNGQSSTALLTSNKVGSWRFYQWKLSNVSSVQVLGGNIDEVRLYPQGAQMTSYTYAPLVGMTSQCDAAGRIVYYEYDGLQRLLRIRDMDGNIAKQYEYQYQVSTGCGSNCYILQMTTFAGTNTLSYPVGVFNVNGKLLGNATSQSQYVSLWNADTADANRGTLAAGGDSLHFNFTLTPGKTMPVLTGCRYYQVDLPYNKIDAVRNWNGCYVDWGDGTGMRLAANLWDPLPSLPPNTTQSQSPQPQFDRWAWYFVHTYPDNSLKTLTFYHNDATENTMFDNVVRPAPSLTYLKNLRGNLPQHTTMFGGHNYQQASMMQTANITNWNSIHSIYYFGLGSGDGTNLPMNPAYEQDFMAGNKDLDTVSISAYSGATFKLSKLKSDWSTYFTHLSFLDFSDAQWDREDLSVLKELNYFLLFPANGGQIPQNVIDSIFNQIATGAGQTVSNGALGISTGGTTRSSASDAAVAALTAKGWLLYLNGIRIN